ncbi:MotA/TolQ/ExbB proton channel family protein [Yoonia sp. GPGPB17]|uniref:MotA/TolQ/ExbB proton channel family protein n=1 Tax=Yoonia sp. GPGPB17 TaxID=3026147 RepID=UPI0030BD148A
MITPARDRILGLLELGGPVVALLLALSVIALTVAIWKAIIFMMEGVGRGADHGFVKTILMDMRTPGGHVDVARAEATAQLDAAFGEMSRGLRVLDLTAQLAPLLGLFGTVLGMIEAFQNLQEAGSTADPSLLAGGIWVALMTTAVGLCVAMPASVLLAWFDGRLLAHRLAANVALEERLGSKTPARAATGNALQHAG